MKTIAIIATLLLALCVAVQPAESCSTFAFTKGPIIVGHSFDYHSGTGMMVVNKRNVAKQALLKPSDKGKPNRWVAKYGSVTFNMVSRELPLGGMNEKGLVVQQMWFNPTKYPPLKANRLTVNELQLIQYLLDSAATTAAAIKLARRVQVARGYAKLHYLICDRAGVCATLEYLDKKLVIHRGKKLRVPVLTNSSYAESIKAWKPFLNKAAKKAVPAGFSSIDRFVRAASLVRDSPKGKGGASTAYRILDAVRQIGNRGATQWQIVYEPTKGTVHFRNAGEKKAQVVKFASLDFSCKTPAQVLDLRGDVTGKRTNKFRNYTVAQNAKLLGLMFKAIKRPLPPPAIQAMARYPDQATHCLAQRTK